MSIKHTAIPMGRKGGYLARPAAVSFARLYEEEHMDEQEILKFQSTQAALDLCYALEHQIPPAAVDFIWSALARLPDCGHEKQKVARAAIADKFGFKG